MCCRLVYVSSSLRITERSFRYALLYLRNQTLRQPLGLLITCLSISDSDLLTPVRCRQGHREFPFRNQKIPPRHRMKFPKIPVSMACFIGPPNTAKMRRFDGRQVWWGKEKKGNAKQRVICNELPALLYGRLGAQVTCHKKGQSRDLVRPIFRCKHLENGLRFCKLGTNYSLIGNGPWQIDNVIDDVTWPWKVKVMIPTSVRPVISKTARDRDSGTTGHL